MQSKAIAQRWIAGGIALHQNQNDEIMTSSKSWMDAPRHRRRPESGDARVTRQWKQHCHIYLSAWQRGSYHVTAKKKSKPELQTGSAAECGRIGECSSPACRGRLGGGKQSRRSVHTKVTVAFLPHPNPPRQAGREWRIGQRNAYHVRAMADKFRRLRNKRFHYRVEARFLLSYGNDCFCSMPPCLLMSLRRPRRRNPTSG